MRFSSWYEVADIPARAPAEPGVLQVRCAELLDYPRGRSAMVHYDASADVRAELLRWTAQLRARELAWVETLRCRHCVELGSRTPAAALTRVLERFEHRFGAAPHLPS